MEKRPSKGLLADMWTFPLTELSSVDFEKIITDGAISKNITMPELPESISKMEYFGNFTHIFSHQKWHIVLIKVKAEEKFEIADELLTADKKWVYYEYYDSKKLGENVVNLNQDLSKISRLKLPLSGPQVKMFELLDKKI